MTSDWRPSTAALDADTLRDVLRDNAVVAIHLWAPWNGHDRTFDERMRTVRGEFAGRVAFRSMDVDSAAGTHVAADVGLVTSPILGIWVRGALQDVVVGHLGPGGPAEVRAHLIEALRMARPANEVLEAFVRAADAGRILRWIEEFLGRLEDVESGPFRVVRRDRSGREIRIALPRPDDWDFSSVWIGSDPALRPFVADIDFARATFSGLGVEVRCRVRGTALQVKAGQTWSISGNGERVVGAGLLERIGAIDEALVAIGARHRGGLSWRVPDRYRERHRAYHTTLHLNEAHEALLECRHRVERWDEVLVALWFHDAIYDAHRHDNEERSADWAREELLAAGAPADVAERVHALVLATKHRDPPEGNDARLLVDADLSILAAPPDRFSAYERQIRQEYDWVPEVQFREARERFLRGMLARPSIFNDAAMRERHDAHARRNIEDSLRRLGNVP